MTPIIINRFLDTNINRLVSPGFSMARSTNYDIIPVGALFAVVIHACKGKNFELDSNGYVPSANKSSLADFTGTPIFAVKTKADWQSRGLDFVASISGQYGPLTSLANGRSAIAGILASDTVSDGTDLFAQVQLQDAVGNKFVAPSSPLPCWIQQPITTGDETGAPVTPILFHGTCTFPAGSDTSAPITLAGLTANAEVFLQQKNTGIGSTGFQYTAATDTLTITADSAPYDPTKQWVVVYDVRSL